ncbi:MFS transporter [Streptacidiphilus jiangxiensis]|uniref:Drug resistance transporter, EmrB/QacA subfamily n=1 Tax=Streptacidiphilus jiangxiensis TaxID=235985 RepID=A0A1H7JGI6_STRJI|nr:MFS transporter [Streptacidiphilus jiangxiensis]SEK73556.1 drug resistance transporter, EmrB/QacA subfamily [Streptacidiphilus jiangxiensis]
MPELSSRRRMLVLAICCMSLFIVGLDNTIVNVALPSIARDLGGDVSSLQWVVDAYVVVLASLLILGGSMGDRFGRRRVFQTGLALFTLGSLACSLAPGLGWLIGARMLQAVGGSMLNPVAMGIITNTFTDPKERARAIGVWGGTVGFSMALGPVVGGVLVGAVGWSSIFWINIPVGLAAMVLAGRFVPESRAPRPRRIDPLGQLAVITLLGSLTYGIIEAPKAGWGSAQSLLCFGLAAAALVALLVVESRRDEPLIELRFFRSAPFSGATLIAISGFAGLGGFLFLNTLYLQDVRDFSALQAGLATLPMALATVVCSPLSGRLVGARGPRLSLVLAGTGMTAGSLLMVGLRPDTPLWQLLLSYLLFGFGFGMLNAPVTNTAVSGMPRAQAGVAAAVASTSRQTGQALGVAVIGSVVTSAVVGGLHSGLAEASHIGWWIMVGCASMVVLLGIVTTGTWARRTAERVFATVPGEKRQSVSAG